MKSLGLRRAWVAAAFVFAACGSADAAIVDFSSPYLVMIDVSAESTSDYPSTKTDDEYSPATGEFHAVVSTTSGRPSGSPVTSETSTASVDFVNALGSAASFTAKGRLSASAPPNACATPGCGFSSGQARVQFTVEFMPDSDTGYALDLDFGPAVTGVDPFTGIDGSATLVDRTTGTALVHELYFNRTGSGSDPTFSYNDTALANHIYRLSYDLSAFNGIDGDSSASNYSVSLNFTPVPLPAAAWLLLSGVGSLVPLVRRRRASPRAGA